MRTLEQPNLLPELPRPSAFDVLGVKVHAIQIPSVVEIMEAWAQNDQFRFIAVTGMHGIVVAQDDPTFKKVLNAADLVVPDGSPLVWLGRRAGFGLPRRVYGPELMEEFCRQTRSRYSHFLFGGTPEVVRKTAHMLSTRFQNRVVGTLCPPFGEIESYDNSRAIELINSTRPDVLWVGISTPKQERWMNSNRHLIKARMAVGVGAAFDYLSGTKSQAPVWMRERGLEWAYRLVHEPRRLWRRYLIGGLKFGCHLFLERSGLKHY